MGAMVMSPAHVEKFKEHQEIDLAYSVAGLGRFRCNIFQQRGTMGLVLRVIPSRILSVDDLLLPPVLRKIAIIRLKFRVHPGNPRYTETPLYT